MPKIYRVLEYSGSSEWIDQTIDQSITGEKKIMKGCTIRAATIDPSDVLSIIFARNEIRSLVATIKTKTNPRNNLQEVVREVIKNHWGSNFNNMADGILTAIAEYEPDTNADMGDFC